MQVGLFATAVEAAPVYQSDSPQRIVQLQGPNDEQVHKENERHQQAMKRRPNESDKEWKQRQQQEQQRHERELRDIQGH